MCTSQITRAAHTPDYDVRNRRESVRFFVKRGEVASGTKRARTKNL